MAEQILNSRIINKHDIESNWLKAVNFIPKQGEIIIYDADTVYSYMRMKIGDGITLVNDLPFMIGPFADDNDALALLSAIGVYHQVADSDGSVLTDEANAILLL